MSQLLHGIKLYPDETLMRHEAVRHVIAGTPVEVVKRSVLGRGRNKVTRLFIRADYMGTPYWGWVDEDRVGKYDDGRENPGELTGSQEHPLADAAYGNQYYKKGNVWWMRHSFRSHGFRLTGGVEGQEFGDWRKVPKDDVRVIERMIVSGRITGSQENPAGGHTSAYGVFRLTIEDPQGRVIPEHTRTQAYYTMNDQKRVYGKLWDAGQQIIEGMPKGYSVQVDLVERDGKAYGWEKERRKVNPLEPGDAYLWGKNRVRGWEKLQGPASPETLEQYKPYFAKDTLADYHRNIPHSGFAGDTRPVYTELRIALKKPKEDWETGKGRRNPESSAAAVYESFHGLPSESVAVYEEEEHYHSNLAQVGVLVEMKVELLDGRVAEIGFEEGEGEGAAAPNPLDITIAQFMRPDKARKIVKDLKAAGISGFSKDMGGSYSPMRVVLAPGGERDLVMQYLAAEKKQNPGYQVRFIRPDQAAELFNLYHLARVPLSGTGKDTPYERMLWASKEFSKLHPEVSPTGAYKDLDGLRSNWFEAPSSGRGRGRRNPDEATQYAGPVLLCTNETGTQLYLVGGDQSLDLAALKIKDTRDSVVIGDVTEITYHTRKQFGDKVEEFDYYHAMGEKGGRCPSLRYDALNERLFIDGGTYKIEQPLIGTSVGIEN